MAKSRRNKHNRKNIEVIGIIKNQNIGINHKNHTGIVRPYSPKNFCKKLIKKI